VILIITVIFRENRQFLGHLANNENELFFISSYRFAPPAVAQQIR
jgi:hypothetical protein